MLYFKLTHSLTIMLFLLATCFGDNTNEKFDIYMEDGQIYSRPIRIYIQDVYITHDMKPTLNLLSMNAEYSDSIQTFDIAQNQVYHIKGKDVPHKGTILMFRLSDIYYSIPLYKSCLRINPIVTWSVPVIDDQGYKTTYIKLKAISQNFVVLGNSWGALFWSLIIFILFIFLSGLLTWKTWKDRGNILGLISTNDGTLSMALTQMAIWTIAVGLMVLGFGLMQLRISKIPDTLVLLMLFSSATSLGGRWQGYRKRKETKVERPAGKFTVMDKFRSLFYLYPPSIVDKKPNGDPIWGYDHDPSLAKAQIFFWTLTTLILFIVKSMLEGHLWDIPYELVFLMGISQGAYIGRNEIALYEKKDELKSLKSV